MRSLSGASSALIVTIALGSLAVSVSGCGKVGWSGVGRRIREVRGLDMTQADFAARVGISQNYLSMMERGPSGDWGGDLAADCPRVRDKYGMAAHGGITTARAARAKEKDRVLAVRFVAT